MDISSAASRRARLIGLLIGVASLCSPAQLRAEQKDAEPATRAANHEVLQSLPFSDRADFDDAQRGFVATLREGAINGAKGPIWSTAPYEFERRAEAPATVNPSLWRQAQLNNFNGLFKVTERVYQIRGLDISNLTIVESDNGLIVIDPLLTAETAKASLELYFEHRPRRPVVAVVYTHSHADHFGGVKGVVSEEDVRAGRTAIIAPDHFLDYAAAENVIAGNAMSRRSWYQFGSTLAPGERGQVDTGLGKSTPRGGTLTLIAPTDLVKEPYETRRIDGVEIEFHLVPYSEAPAEMTLFFPQLELLDMAEDATHNMHNLYTIRGAEVRDARLWSRYIGEALERYGESAQILIAQHHWPIWGAQRIAIFLKHHRDLYKFIHDQSVRLLNAGYTPAEIAEKLKLPESLARDWSTRGYYGTLSHNAKAVYQKYLGWYDANPANLQPLPPVESAKKTIEYMGGAAAVLSRAREDFKAGHYRWVASVASQLVFADPTDRAARDLAADALEQLGYQAEAGTWRNAYLTGAQELREGVPKIAAATTLSPDTLGALDVDLLFDFLAVRVNADKAEGKSLVIEWTFTDIGKVYVLNLENSALTHTSRRKAEKADARFTLTRATLDKILLKQRSFLDAIRTGDVEIHGNPLKLGELLGLLDDFRPDFPIVEPKPAKN